MQKPNQNLHLFSYKLQINFEEKAEENKKGIKFNKI